LYSAGTLRLVIEASATVTYYHDELQAIFVAAGVPQSLLGSVPPRDDRLRPSKREVARHVVMGLARMGDSGVGPLRAIVREILEWSAFSDGVDVDAARLVQRQLRSATEVQRQQRDQEHRDVQLRKVGTALQTAREGEYWGRLSRLHDTFLQMSKWEAPEQRQQRGYALQNLLYELFEISDLRPKGSFRIHGEQIDGAFVLDSDDYLVEARWREKPADEADLLVLHGKIEGKLECTRGVFLSLSGYSREAIQAFTTGKRPRMVLMDGCDLACVLEGHIHLANLLREKIHVAARTGQVYAPAPSIIS
jgi:hypothetical protein